MCSVPLNKPSKRIHLHATANPKEMMSKLETNQTVQNLTHESSFITYVIYQHEVFTKFYIISSSTQIRLTVEHGCDELLKNHNFIMQYQYVFPLSTMRRFFLCNNDFIYGRFQYIAV